MDRYWKKSMEEIRKRIGKIERRKWKIVEEKKEGDRMKEGIDKKWIMIMNEWDK